MQPSPPSRLGDVAAKLGIPGKSHGPSSGAFVSRRPVRHEAWGANQSNYGDAGGHGTQEPGRSAGAAKSG